MAGSLIPFDGAPPPSLRNRRSNLLAAAKAGVQASFAVLTYKGRNWRVKHRGDSMLLKGDDNKTPVGFLDIVIVGIAPAISKQYYEKSYAEGDDAAPDCFSLNGQTPDPTSPKLQNATCANCKRNQFGSRMTDAGKKAKECQDTRRLAIVPYGDEENEMYGGPMLLRIPPMSLNNLANYADLLERKQASFETVVTRISFDFDVAYPRITFEAMGFLDDETLDRVIGKDGNGGVCADPLIDRVLGVVEAPPPAENVTPLRRPVKASDPKEEPEPEPEPEEEVEEEEQAPPPPAQEPPAQPAAAPRNPFAAATQAAGLAAGKPAAPKRAPRAQPTAPAAAPSSMEDAIHNLLDQQIA